MAQVKILIQGYTSADAMAEGGEEKTCPTITLVRDKNVIMVIDPGVLENQQLLISKLKDEGLTVDDVNFVCVTHSHADHYRNAGMFPKAKLLEYWALWNGNVAESWEEQFTDDILIAKTPGHNYDALTIFVKTPDGLVAICGDIFWKEGGPQDDPYASDPEKLKESRQKVLSMADWIIPGHGGVYKARKEA